MGISSLFYRLGVAVSVLAFAVGCSNGLDREPAITEPVTASESTANQSLGSGELGYRVLGAQALNDELLAKAIERPSSKRAQRFLKEAAAGVTVAGGSPASEASESTEIKVGSLTLGFPLELLGEAQVFGGVITKVSDKDSEDLGRLKLTDLSPIHVTPAIAQDSGNQFYFVLRGCASKCSEGSEDKTLLVLPLLGIDFVKKLLYVDLAGLGEELNLVAMLDPDGAYTKLKTKESKTVAMDYSLSTLVFDVKTTMVPLDPAQTKETDFTVRWYLRLASHFDQSFVSRPATEGVGFFMTERAVHSKIQRFRLSSVSGRRVKYYIKSVPAEYQKSFASAFDEWNEKFVANTGRKLLEYEFVAADDPRSALLVAGDPRYNIVEWDLDNRAPYGGLGPSIAHQFTGEIITANVLIQGPHIIKMYSKWFEASQTAETLMLAGRQTEAQLLLKKVSAELNASMKSEREFARFDVKLGELEMRVAAQVPALEDPLFQREDFEPLPAGYSFAQYMDGYFHDMVAHELGHNLGLRHNFHGNLEAAEGTAPQYGKVSNSIMEYLGRGFRYLDRIGTYDEMAIAYGYAGKLPTQKDLFCTDDDVPDADALDKSAECSRDDATRDPFGFFQARLQRTVDLIVNRGSADAPVWKPADMERELASLIPPMGIYAATADKTASTWKRFFIGGDRPTSAAGVKAYVVDTLNGALCGPEVESALAQKASEEVRAATRANLAALTTKVGELLAPLKTIDATQLGCVVPTVF